MKQFDINTDAESLLGDAFEGLHSGGGRSSIPGGQTAANLALESLSLKGYAKNRSEVLPIQNRGATVLSPYIRHNIIQLPKLWELAAKAPQYDKEKFRDELLWQEYARHLYARIGTRLFENLRFEQNWDTPGDGWPRGMACIDFVLDELNQDGWLVNQTRMWLASHWSVRNNKGWLHGQERMHQELIDGSRAANLLGWQWTVGTGTGKPYGFARWQVQKRAPSLCRTCPLNKACPIENFPAETQLESLPVDPLLSFDPTPELTTGPLSPIRNQKPDVVLLTIESLGDMDPAMVANPELTVAFVFNQPALEKLQLSSKRIYFYLETLQDLANRRELSVYLGDPVEFAKTNRVAVTHAPVPSFAKFQNLAEVHPYPWLKLPHSGSVKSFSAWRGKLR
ncbi:FAD-binding domain-containing protein [Candidatus Aquiluna sp. UB-MaderosW2red]|uniref:FAD-binding domain-containing protein n=1 Tax=Candidatus Aquiluna sp. UB-MaderosW2red TaxID=1855377 RepID=UPI000875DF9F|nr:FAD-binding domain-containing protein [Candidatus Aquiluna sp. UB-MaderosW2red]SCX05507.1 deoxyribodipyrimidine photo-lyase [Candidatus Aquiluna sp. UB-MaderosW2red]